MSTTAMRRTALQVASALGVATLAACGGTPDRSVAMEDARSRYAAAERDADVQSRAPLELRAAGTAVAQADNAWQQRADVATVDHLAYLARQRTAIAVETARLRGAEADIAQASNERDRVLLAARTREAQEAQRAAMEAQGRAQQAQMSAEQRRQQAEAEQRRADEARRLAAEEQRRAEEARQLAAAEQRRTEEARQQVEAERLRAEELSRQAAAAQQQVTEAQARTREMELRLQELEARKTERGMVVTLGDVLFDVGRSELRPTARRTVERLADFMRKYPEYRVAIEGFTDSTGTPTLNAGLSQQRAQAVRLALVDAGIAPDRSTARGFGEAHPVASNANAAGRQLNRRVEVVISDANGNIPERSADGGSPRR